MTGTLYSLQWLRFVAAAFVVLSHASSDLGLPDYGNFGVDIFFVISGFIIFHVTRAPSPDFLLRRVIRVAPLYWIGTLVLAAVALNFPGALHNVSFDPARLLASLFFVPYWDPQHGFHPLLLLGWTLNFEMLFYLVFAVSMRISHRHRMTISAGILVGLVMLNPFVPAQSALAFWSKPFILEFVYGMSIAYLFGRPGGIATWKTPLPVAIATFVGYALLLYPAFGYPTQGELRFLAVGLPSAMLVVVILTTEHSIQTRFRRWLPALAFAGDLSYSLYIFHPYVLGVGKRVIGTDQSILAYFPLVLALSCLVATATYLILENPARRFLVSALQRRRSLPSTPLATGRPLAS